MATVLDLRCINALRFLSIDMVQKAGTNSSFSEDRAVRLQAYGGQTLVVDEGNDLDAVNTAIAAARAEITQPSLVPVRSDAGGWSLAGRRRHFGVREHAVGAIVNGLAANGGSLPCGSTFFIASDYRRPAIRLAALMGLQLVHVFTHDSIAVGEDGPTHQPVEQLASLRAMPNLRLIRPADANETAVAWQVAIETRDRPVLLLRTRQNLPTLDRNRHGSAEGLRRGAYFVRELIPAGAISCAPDLILSAAERLCADGLALRWVSMPSWDLFDAQPRACGDEELPPTVRARLAVELEAAQGWHRHVGDNGDVLGVEGIGRSARGRAASQFRLHGRQGGAARPLRAGGAGWHEFH